MKTFLRPLLIPAALTASLAVQASDPLVDSWLTTDSGKYARLYLTDADRLAGESVTTWSGQTLPAYAGVIQIASTVDWVYIKTSSLGFHTLGPWYNNAAHTVAFPNWPRNQLATYRFPRTVSVPATKTNTGLGGLGYFVDGVTMFDGRDGQTWNGTGESPMGTGSWERDAWINEGVTFDPAQAHQENSGTYHYHANPLALRSLLGDHVDFDTTTRLYRESTTAVSRHSPILGWIRDGSPIYGPYGYSQPLDSTSAVRRMVSGYQLRNGTRGTDNLTATGRTAIPAWATRRGFSAQTGPAVSATYPLGRYMQDNAYLGDLTNSATAVVYQLGTDFDLDEYNGRFCITPEFPQGVYAYFVTIEEDGSPKFPYLMGRAFHGDPTGAAASLAGTETLHFNGGTNLVEQAAVAGVDSSNGEVILEWSSLEGGTYRLDSSPDLKTWKTLAASQAATADSARTAIAVLVSNVDQEFYRVTRTSVADYDSTGGGGGTGGPGGGGGPALASVLPMQGNRGTTVTLSMTIAGMAPPANISPTSASLGGIVGTTLVRNGAVVTARFAIPANAIVGPVTVSVVFPGPPGMGLVTFSLVNGFTIQ